MSRIKIPVRKPSAPPVTERLAVSKREASQLLGGVSERTLDNWVKQGKLTARKIGGRVLFPVSSLEAFLSGTGDDGSNR